MRASFAVLPILAALVAASPAPAPAPVAEGIKVANATLSQRDYTDARFTWYEVGQGACGGTNTDSEYVVALNSDQYDGGAYCWELINISYNGQSTQAAIVDECPGCPYGGLDLSPSLFSFLAGSTAPGVIYGEWSFA
ncbi:hypothetical protein EW026_g6794 [Hermanssonia centrifuga]|uniref:Uncharacterized protein n=1 Tax=Hermanssonia centrifuga TaxID=98765 RepID=A0A4S4KAU2_9APHY|nr:hypothetical protein EW026_g6794 [Hermanssonia centrifuga]